MEPGSGSGRWAFCRLWLQRIWRAIPHCPSLRPVHVASKQFATGLLEWKEDVIEGEIPVGPLLGFEGRMGPHLHIKGNTVSFKRKSRLRAVIRAPKLRKLQNTPWFQDLGRSAYSLFRHVLLPSSPPIQIGRNDVGGLNPQSAILSSGGR